MSKFFNIWCKIGIEYNKLLEFEVDTFQVKAVSHFLRVHSISLIQIPLVIKKEKIKQNLCKRRRLKIYTIFPLARNLLSARRNYKRREIFLSSRSSDARDSTADNGWFELQSADRESPADEPGSRFRLPWGMRS